jgi:peptidoglycan/LPS O-acetylase OafA/YrhL
MQYRKEIDGLRALAVLPVIFFHAGFQVFSGGFVGVDVFFVISGYLITSIILEEKQAGKFSLINFYERRARRILPALFVVMFTSLLLAWLFLLPGDMKIFSQSLVAISGYVSNIFFWRATGYFAPTAETNPLLHTWSLAVEEQYYLLFPIFLSMIWKLRKQWILGLLALVAIISFEIAQWGSLNQPTPNYYLLPSRAWELLIGSLIAFYLFTKDSNKNKTEKIGQLLSLIGLLLIIYAVCAFDKQTPFPGSYALIPTIGTALIILFTTPQTIVGNLLGRKFLVGIGLISYSTYLWHQPLFAFARYNSIEEPSKVILGGLAGVSLVLGYFSWKYVETPFRNRERIKRNQIFLFGALCSFLFVVIGLIGNFTTGFSYRYAQEDRPLAEIVFTENGKYVDKRFNEHRLSNFDNTNKVKVLLIGDSYSQDLVNALYESGLSNKIQLSTRFIRKNCGNLFLNNDDFKSNIDKGDLTICNNDGWFEDKNLRKLMTEADQIWLASAWQYWQAKLLPESILNLQHSFGKKILVFGTKNFGDYTIKSLLKKPIPERYQLKGLIRERDRKVNTLMKNTLSKDIFIDVSDLLCGDSYKCPLFTKDGKLISYDGAHLTMDGAKYYGENLSQHPLLRSLAKKQ